MHPDMHKYICKASIFLRPHMVHLPNKREALEEIMLSWGLISKNGKSLKHLYRLLNLLSTGSKFQNLTLPHVKIISNPVAAF